MRKKRKIVRNYHKDGRWTYAVKFRIWPFWFTEFEFVGYYFPLTVYKNIPSLKEAIDIMNQLNEKGSARDGDKIVKTEDMII